MSTITLTKTIGAHTLEVYTAGLAEGAGGVALRFMLYDGPMAFTLSDDEARALIGQIEQQLGEVDADAGQR